MTIQTTHALVERISPLTDSIIELILTPNNYIPYQAGQYLQIQCVNEFLSYSIANAPLGSHKYELHIRHEPGNRYNRLLLDDIKQHAAVEIHLPLGDCHINQLNNQTPIIFIAAGTGFAPIKAIIEQLLANGDQRVMELYWGARSQSDLYLDQKVLQWQHYVNHFRYFAHLPQQDSSTTLADLVLAQHPHDLPDYQVVLGGPFDLVYTTRDILVAHGVAPSQLYSDAFSFEQQGD